MLIHLSPILVPDLTDICLNIDFWCNIKGDDGWMVEIEGDLMNFVVEIKQSVDIRNV